MSEEEYTISTNWIGSYLTRFNSQDPFIKFISDEANLVVVSVGYRLAPEDPFPKGPEDCYDVAEWLVDKSKAKFGGQLKFVGGEVRIYLLFAVPDLLTCK